MHLTGEEEEASCGESDPHTHTASKNLSSACNTSFWLAKHCSFLLALEHQGREAARVPGLGALAAERRLGPRVACLWGGAGQRASGLGAEHAICT